MSGLSRGPALERPASVYVLDVMIEDRAALLEVLAELDEAEWARPTACAGWSVGDVALHLLGGELARISRGRDGFIVAGPAGEDLVTFLNRFNEEWVRAARRLSPRMVRELLAVSGPLLWEHFASLDPLALGGPVSWAGPRPAPVWLDLAREYVERWHHQQHIRDAVGRPGQTAPRYLAPVVATIVHALPMAFRGVEAEEGTAVGLTVKGDAGGEWSVVRAVGGWELFVGAAPAAAARVALDGDTAWRLFTKGIGPDEARRRAMIAGEARLVDPVFRAVAIIA